MINVHDNYWIPSEGFSGLTNGDIITDSIYLGKADSIENWHDTNEGPSDLATIEDFEAALSEMGVSV